MCVRWRPAASGFGIVAGTGTGKTLAIRPIAETILGTTTLARRRRQSRTRSDAGDAHVERGDRHHRHRAPLVSGWRHPAARTRWSSTKSTRRAPSSSCAWRWASASGAASSGCRRRSIRRSTRGTSTAPTCCRCRRSTRARRRRSRCERKQPLDVPRRQVPAEAGALGARRGDVPADARGGGGGRRVGAHAISAHHRRALSRRRADSRDPPVPRRHDLRSRSFSR